MGDYFERGSFKQEVLDEIELCARMEKLTPSEVCVEVAEVLQYLCSTAFTRDATLEAVREETRKEVGNELVKALKAEGTIV